MSDRRLPRRRRALITLLVLGVLSGLLVVTDLFRLLVAPLTVSSALRKVDAVVVFGGGLSGDGRLGISTDERVRYASALYRQGLADHVIISGGYRVAPRFEEAQGMASLLIQLGVPKDRILLDRRARNTFENARH